MLLTKKIPYLPISIILFLCAIYRQTASFSIMGFIGFAFITSIVLIICYKVIEKEIEQSSIHISVTVFSISLFYFILSIIGVSFAFSRLGIMLYLSLFMVCVYWENIFKIKNLYFTLTSVFLVCAIILFSLYITNNMGSFSPDSYGYYDISKTFFDDFGNLKTIRQYSIQTTYNISFPYLYPLFLWIINMLTGLGIYSGFIFNLYIVIITGSVILRLSKDYTDHLYLGTIIFSLLIVNKEYLEEVVAARSIPLAVCIVITLVYFTLKCIVEQNTTKQLKFLFILGILSGLYLATRQDGLILIPYIIVIILIFAKKKISKILVYLIGFLIIYLPQITYSLLIFGKPFISDNSGTFLKVDPTCWIALPGEIKTIFNAPQEWTVALFNKIFNVFISLIKCSYPCDILIILCLVLIMISLVKKYITLSDLNLFIVVFIFYFGKTAMYMLVGYPDVRYHIETVIMTTMICMYSCLRCGLFIGLQTNTNKVNFTYKKYLIGFFVVFSLLSCYSLKGSIKSFLMNYRFNDIKMISEYPTWISDLEKEIEKNGVLPTDKIMVIGSGANPYSFGSYSGRYVYAMPGGITSQQASYIINKYDDIDYVLIQNSTEYSDIIAQFVYEKDILLDSGWYLIKVN